MNTGKCTHAHRSTLKRQLVPLDENVDGLLHEVLGHLQNLIGHGGGEQAHLRGRRQQLEDVVDLLGETARQHLIGLVENEHAESVNLERATVDHVKDTTGRADNNVHALLQLRHVLADVRATNARVALGIHVVAQGHDDFLNLLSELARRRKNQSLALLHGRVDALQKRDGKRRSLARTRLCLRNHLVALYDGRDGLDVFKSDISPIESNERGEVSRDRIASSVHKFLHNLRAAEWWTDARNRRRRFHEEARPSSRAHQTT